MVCWGFGHVLLGIMQHTPGACLVCERAYVCTKVALQEGPKNGGEDAPDAVITELSEAEDVHVAQHTCRHRVAASARWAHGSHNLGVHNVFEGAWGLPLIPVGSNSKHSRVSTTQDV